MALYPGTTAGNTDLINGWGLAASDYPPGDITPWLSGRDPNQTPQGPIIPPIILPPGLGGWGGTGGRAYPPLQSPVPPPPSTTGVGGLGGGRPGNPLPSLGGGAPVSSSGIDWSKVLTGLGQSIQGGIQGYQTPPGGQQGGGGRSAESQQGGRTPQTAPPPRMQTQAPIPPQMFPQAMPGGSAIATAPISPLSLPSGSSAPLSPTILNTRPTMPQFMGSFQAGGIVPRTGLYPVVGGEQVIPKKKVKKVAKLHKGEMVLPPRFVGSFQEGGVIPPDPMNLPQGSAAPFPTDISGYPTTAAQAPTREDQAKYAALQLAKLVGQRFGARGQGTAGGGAPEGGSVAFQGRVGPTGGTTNAPPMMNLMAFQQAMAGGGTGGAGAATGAAGTGLPVPIPPVQQVPQVPGMPMGPMPDVRPGAYGGPALYAQSASLPPYQSQFAPGGRAQYVTQNLLGGLSNALLQWQQQQFDKKAQQSMADAALLANAAGTAAPQQAAGGGGTPPTPATAGQSTFQRQAQALGGAAQPGTNAFQGAAAQIGQMRPGQPGVPTQAQTNEPQRAPMTQEQQQAYQTLQKTNPKLAQHFSDIIGKQHDRAMKNFAKAQMNPSGPEYRGMMAYYQQMQAQQQQQAEAAAKIANANAALMNAQAAQQEAQQQMAVQQYLGKVLSGQDQPTTQPGQQAPAEKNPAGSSMANNPGGPFAALGPMSPGEGARGRIALEQGMAEGKLDPIRDELNKIDSDRKIHGSGKLEPDPNSKITGYSRTYFDAYGREVMRTQDAFDSWMAPVLGETNQVVTDAYGNQYLLTKPTVRQRGQVGQPSGGPQQPTQQTQVTPPATGAPKTPGANPSRPAPLQQTRITPILTPDGVQLHKPLSQQGKNSITQMTSVLNMANGIQPELEAAAQALEAKGSTLWGSVAERGAWAQYMHGLDPNNIDPTSPVSLFPNTDKRITALLPTLAQFQMVGIQAYLHGNRNWNYISQIQQHLPNPAIDSPSLMASKMRNIGRTMGQLESAVYRGEGIEPRLDRQMALNYLNQARRETRDGKLIGDKAAITLAKQWATMDGWNISQVPTQ